MPTAPLCFHVRVWWRDAGYKPWDEIVDDGANIKAAYRLADPDWSQIQSKLPDGTNIYARPFILELDVAVDGVGAHCARLDAVISGGIGDG